MPNERSTSYIRDVIETCSAWRLVTITAEVLEIEEPNARGVRRITMKQESHTAAFLIPERLMPAGTRVGAEITIGPFWVHDCQQCSLQMREVTL
jgi:hypothetical protein